MEKIQYKGLSELEDVDQAMVRTLTEEYYPKIQRELKNVTSLVVHIKGSSKGGHRTRYELGVRAEAPTRIFESHTEEWDLARGLHKVFKDIEREIQHHFKD
ncbi:hypothetical protein KY362_05230 [Candidatus Woesearchaeota archaeon]|nr:hypothetical protein [Candidatus Woesearchaeota archaeon]